MKRISLVTALLCLITFICTGDVWSQGDAPLLRFPATVSTIEGEELDLKKIARKHTLVVVTLKATWCPVCQAQLARIKSKLPEIKPCGVSFLVLAPGPKSQLRSIKKKIGFPYPFVEDVDLTIAKKLGLQLSEREIVPSIFILNSDLSVGWMQRGRNARSYGDSALIEKINCGNWI